ncbi:hypothetical protein LMG24235_06761 [Paraburkholderia sabiae]|nr:hypothetical protein [Paraburkholderia sabiae]CAD6559787.1 hypothetical protein LMG24235_06761 [Paraburkholderia sabiae]CAG9230585.1 hypothetical protein PSAB6_520022 [Paraburkholderia sabiae]
MKPIPNMNPVKFNRISNAYALRLPLMDLSFALQFFAAMLTLICITLTVVVMRIDPAPTPTIVRIRGLRRRRWPCVLTRAGLACLLASFVLLIAGCYLLLTM